MNEKRSSNVYGNYVMRRFDEMHSFVCDRCLEPKSSKIEVEWEDPASGRTKTICNGCFGRLGSLADA